MLSAGPLVLMGGAAVSGRGRGQGGVRKAQMLSGRRVLKSQRGQRSAVPSLKAPGEDLAFQD